MREIGVHIRRNPHHNFRRDEMSVTQQVNDLVQKFSGNINLEEPAEQPLAAKPLVTITGAIVERRDSSLVLEVGEVRLEIPIKEIRSLQENPSAPAIPDGMVYVDLQVAPTAKVVEFRVRTAAEYGRWLGKRPFVYELPSQASEFAVPDDEYQAQQRQWLEKVGLDGFQEILMARHTPQSSTENTYSNTHSQTYRSSHSSTFTPRDTQTDHRGDYDADNRPDNRSDMKSDYRFDP